MSTSLKIAIPRETPSWAVAIVRSIQQQLESSTSGPQRLTPYTVATAPDATKWLNYQIIVSNEAGGRTVATSDGANWRRVRDGAVIS